MPLYKYTARTALGKSVTGTMTAANEAALHAALRDDGKYLISAREKNKRVRRRPIKSLALSEFCRNLGVLTGSGVTLMRALNIIAQEETITPNERAVYDELRRNVRQGVALSDSMDSMEGVFPPLMINMMRSAETTGNLDKTAMRLADHFDKEYRLHAKIKSSTMYPKILGVMLVLAVVIIMAFVMPTFDDLFSTLPELPFATRAMIWMSDMVVHRWWLLIILAVSLYAITKLLLSIPNIRRAKDKFVLRMPLIGKLQKTICTARFARTLSSLYASGISIVTSLQVARKTVGNTYIDSQFDAVIERVRAGSNLSEGLDMVDGFIKKLTSSIRVGEETGALDSMLYTTADMLDHESEQALAKMVGYLEPAMIIFMGLLIAMVILGVIMPVYNSYQNLSNY